MDFIGRSHDNTAGSAKKYLERSITLTDGDITLVHCQSPVGDPGEDRDHGVQELVQIVDTKVTLANSSSDGCTSARMFFITLMVRSLLPSLNRID